MIVRARLDLTWRHFARAVAACFIPLRKERLVARIRRALPGGDEAVVSLAVRSGFDVLLDALDLPPGSEVLLSAITVPDMARIVRAHGLVPVPVDVDPDTLQPDPWALEAARSPRSRVLVVAHLFGGVADLSGARAFARAHDLLFIEDCAQAFIPGEFHGHPDSDVRMLSFGPIKTSTALGGAVLFVRDPRLRLRMEAAQATRSTFPTRAYVARILKYGALQLLSSRVCFAVFRLGCRLSGKDVDAVLRYAARGFPGGDLMVRIRRRPSTAVLALLAHRLEAPNGRVAARVRAAQELDRLLAGRVRRPGLAVARHAHWIFPVLTRDPQGLMAHLRGHGIDSTHGSSSLSVVPLAEERPEVLAPMAEDVMRQILFVPAYPELSAEDRNKVAQALVEWLEGEEEPRPALVGKARSA